MIRRGLTMVGKSEESTCVGLCRMKSYCVVHVVTEGVRWVYETEPCEVGVNGRSLRRARGSKRAREDQPSGYMKGKTSRRWLKGWLVMSKSRSDRSRRKKFGKCQISKQV